MSIRIRLLIPALLWALCGPAQAQNEKPAVNTAQPEAPAVDTAKAAPKPGSDGTTIIGDRESPIGLYITPWRNAAAEVDIDRPARLLSLDLEPVDKRVFSRQVEYYEALAAAQRAKTPAPAAAAPSPSSP
ncbi:MULTISPECIES: hypothetical protein [Hydrocarboniphaga]|uniref:Uncharacterized protein n=1 Tax=Hydrocarboniphaga effusa AP103 TaxID=1172194 RepID=I7Z7J5_9GAMM|nr:MULTISPECIES: hypothetical protein [Hydrocarboniphaga]EIT67567.1 hypothetical protein WQQ_40020 [Hydrocarboniphaga effusa AP103]MDZ4080153.1 hypothetical protein [Hydrocarboniphaga sp.]